MSDVGYSKLITECDFKEDDKAREEQTETGGGDMEVKPLQNRKRQYKRHLLTNAQKSFVFLEYQSLVDFVEADTEYVISAGRDHDVNVWDAIEGKHLRRFTGHSGPVTGLHFDQSLEEKIIISASEDGDIRKWSISRGFIGKIETGHIITCMGIINNVLAVTGNNKGYMEVRHLLIGELYSSILAHEDPIEALAVDGNYACSAVFDYPSCLKVWEIQFEQTACIYRIENPRDVEFRSLAVWNTMVILGTSNPSLQAVDFKSGEKRDIDLSRPDGSVQHVRVWNEWILSCCAHNESVLLDVHRIHNFEYFGTFNCNMKHVSTTAAVEFDNSLKIILGGSSLAILSFDFILTQDVIKPYKSMKHNYDKSKNKSHYTLKNTESYGETSTDSEDNNCDKSISQCDENILSQRYIPKDEIHSNNIWGSEDQLQINNKDRNETAKEVQMAIGSTLPFYTTDNWPLQPEKNNTEVNKEIRQAPMSNRSTLAHNGNNIEIWTLGIGNIETSFPTYAEPRVEARKLRQPELDSPFEKLGENKAHRVYFETLEEARQVLLKDNRDNLKKEKSEDADEDKLDSSTKDEANKGDMKELNIGEIEKGNVQSEKAETITEKPGFKSKITDDNAKTLEHSKKFSCRKKEKCKSSKKKTTDKNKRKRCQIM